MDEEHNEITSLYPAKTCRASDIIIFSYPDKIYKNDNEITSLYTSMTSKIAYKRHRQITLPFTR